MYTPVPSMSTSGWISDPSSKLDRLLSYYFISRADQDALNVKTVYSINYLLAKNSYNPIQACEEIQINLKQYLQPYFQSVTVTATSDAESISGSQAVIFILVQFVDSGYTSANSYAFDVKSSTFGKVADAINN